MSLHVLTFFYTFSNKTITKQVITDNMLIDQRNSEILH
jgi:hypothetical protein